MGFEAPYFLHDVWIYSKYVTSDSPCEFLNQIQINPVHW